MNKIYIFLTLSILFIQYNYAQKLKTDANIFGHAVSGTKHLSFVNITIKGTTIGTVTDETGHYQLINVPVGKIVIVASAVGYKQKEISIINEANKTTEVNFTLEEDVLQLDEVVISANKNNQKRVESPVIVNTITPKLFIAAQSVTLSESLNFCPGLRLENNCQNCGFTQVRMNGMEGPYSQILINNHPIFSGLAGVYGLELIPSNMIERVEVIRGGGSALYGSNAIAGTINLILKNPIMNSYEVGINTGVIGIATKDSGITAPDYSINFNTSLVSDDRKTGVCIYSFIRDRKMFDANNDNCSEIAPLTNITIGSRFFHRFGYRNKLSVDFFNIKEERAGGNRHNYPFHERDIAEAVRHNLKTFAVIFERYFREYDLFSIYASGQHINRDSYYGANRSLDNYGKTKDFTYNIGTHYKVLIGNATIIAGVENTGGMLCDIKLGYPDYDEATIFNDSIIDVPHKENTTVADQNSITTGLFAQFEIKLHKIKITVGGRYDNYTIKDLQKNGNTKTGNVISPRISFLYDIKEYLQTRVSYSQGYRAPQIFDEDLHIETSGSRQVINVNDPDLKQETSNSFMVSLDLNKKINIINLGLLVEGFYTKLYNPFVNEIGIPDENGIVTYTRMNSKNGALVQGLNIELKLKPNNNFSFSSGITIQSSKYEEKHEFNANRFFRTPDNYGFFMLEWNFIKNTYISVTGNYTGKMLVPYFGPYTNPIKGELRESNPFFDTGLKLRYNIKLNGATLQCFGGIKNIFNAYQSDFDKGIERDPSYIYGPTLPRTIYIGLKIGNIIN